jgi:hypothetical protein
MIDKFVGKPYNYLYNQFKVDLDELLLGLEERIAVLEAVAAFQLSGVWWEPALPLVPTTFTAVGTPVMLAGGVSVMTLTDPATTLYSADTALTATTSTQGRYYTAHCLLTLHGTAGDLITVTAYKREASTNTLHQLHRASKEVVHLPGPADNEDNFTFYATETAEAGDSFELWVTNETSTDQVELSVDSSVRLRAI